MQSPFRLPLSTIPIDRSSFLYSPGSSAVASPLHLHLLVIVSIAEKRVSPRYERPPTISDLRRVAGRKMVSSPLLSSRTTSSPSPSAVEDLQRFQIWGVLLAGSWYPLKTRHPERLNSFSISITGRGSPTISWHEKWRR